MASSRRSNGRSPLVNQQRQITSFFSKTNSPSPSPSPTLAKQTSQLNPYPKPNRSSSTSPSPTTPSPVQSKPKKPILVIGQTPSPTSSTPAGESYGEEVVEKRIRVYWPLDKEWYEGVVKSFDEESGKHLVQYDDAEEEELDLRKEKIEWVKETTGKLKRLRRGFSSAFKRVVIDDDDTAENVKEESDENDDDSGDEDWGKNMGKEVNEDTEVEDMDLVDEKEEDEEKEDKLEEEEGGIKMLKRKGREKTESRKRKTSGGRKLDSGKKSKTNVNVCKEEFKVSLAEPVKKIEMEKVHNNFDSALVSDAPERFGKREAQKLLFLSLKERRDANRKRPGDVNYNPKTLYMPHDFLKSLTGGQRQWWEFKSMHMDKVLFFKMGKFYELFEMDAHIGAKELDLQYMKGEQPHCGFPEKNFSMNLEKLARKGYRVLVVEQTETPEQLELRRKEKGAKDKVVKREICAVVTKGTLTEGEMLSANPDPSYIMSVTESCQSNEGRFFGVCAVDVATSRILLGQFEDDPECSALCCLLAELRPVEIIKPTKLLSFETERAMLRYARNPLVSELIPSTEFWDAEKTISEVKTIYKHINDQPDARSVNHMVSNAANSCETNGSGCLPAILYNLMIAGANGSLALSALGGALYYLKQAFLDETLLRFAKFELLPSSGFRGIAQNTYMLLDAAALENLEIFENCSNGDTSGTLYAQLNHCMTSFGKRCLKTWLARPLYHIDLIKERQDAVAGLKGVNLSYAVEFRKALARLPDMERLLARIFACSEANGRNAHKVILYEDAAKKQLQEFISALRGCEMMIQACSSLGVILESVESTQLHHLLTPGKGLPDVNSILKHFKVAFDWADANNSGRIIPCEGVDLEYDSACEKVKEIESSLTKHLNKQRKLLGDSSLGDSSIVYVTVGKDVYLLEVPENLGGSVPQDYELRSSKKGFFRYWTPYIKKSVAELSQAESEKEAALKNILQRLIGRFCEDHDKWRQLVSTTAELDVLISIAIASDFYEGPTCRPVILGSSYSNEVPCFSAKSLGHPILRSDSLGKGTFVPNDICFGGSGPSFILLTGPNMGGKSTLLRQVCLAVILAQVGADVPAEHFELSPVDRIFVRMGAKDHIMAGQSTFLTELSETALMLSSATQHSLVALDELGRGTSTSDGQAIAGSVLEHFVHKVHCRGMFSTHYHRLAVDYQNNSKVSLCHMACQVGNVVAGVEEVTFLYRMSAGACPKSYGVNVARLAGLPESVLVTAAAKSREFEAVYGKRRKRSEENLPIQGCTDKMIAFIQELCSLTANANCSNTSKATSISSLTELQHKARLLLQQR